MKELNDKELMLVEGGGSVFAGTGVDLNGNNGSAVATAYTKVIAKYRAYAVQKTFTVSTQHVQFAFSASMALGIN